ncbi:solute carrier family 26 member 6-like isoform X5 [Photinus pyralis]|uniref:solute carrier family 26 member 6-like isoform X5 n=1 Tax=Photinus pyralis TaxID=7054 RepID=UPI0012671509|nr:solute carrier family 26 member 6-like isoform X5 [Photinus pyralis]
MPSLSSGPVSNVLFQSKNEPVTGVDCAEIFPRLAKSGMEDERFVTQAALHVQRPVYQTEELNEVTTYQYRTPDLRRTVQKKFASCKAKSCIFNTVPILKWLPRYNWRKNIAGDLASGLTIAIMHIPQGMAYALLGNLPPITGLYMAFFPVLVYVLFGTSRHVSMGTFAVVCLMTGKVVSEYSNDGTSANATDFNEDFYYTPMQVATTVTFTVAAFQIRNRHHVAVRNFGKRIHVRLRLPRRHLAAEGPLRSRLAETQGNIRLSFRK